MKKACLILGLLVLSLYPGVTAEVAEEETNFTLRLITNIESEARSQLVRQIQTALIPLHIDVEVDIYDFGNYVRDLVHAPGFKPWDMALLGWAGTMDSNIKTSSSDDDFGCAILEFCNDEWYEWLLENTGVNQSDVNALIKEIVDDFAFQDPSLDDHLQEFQKLYMENLLYEIPLLLRPGTHATPSSLQKYGKHNGFFGSFDTYEDIFLGMQWEDQPDRNILRVSGAPCLSFGLQCDLDPFSLTMFTNQEAIWGPLHSQLMMLDDDFHPHPFLAKQWERSDWITDSGDVIEGGNFTYWLYDDLHWMKHNSDGSILLDDVLTPDDFAFFFDYYETRDGLSDGSKTEYQVHQNANAFSVFLNSSNEFKWYHSYALSQIRPMPSFLLDTQLTYNTTLSATPLELFEMGLNPEDTEEWMEFAKNPTLLGPYEFVNHTYTEEFNFKIRDDFWYPNEWDTEGSDFAKHIPGPEEAYYFAFNATTEEPNREVTELHISEYKLVISQSPDEMFNKFYDKEIDFIYAIGRWGGYDLLQELQEDPDVNVYINNYYGSGDRLVFHLDNPYLKHYEVRRAIAHAIDKQSINKLYNDYLIPNDSPVFNYLEEHYNDEWKIEYDYTKARDLMRSLNYTAREKNQFSPVSQAESLIVPSAVSDLFLNMTGILLLLVVGGFIRGSRRDTYT